MQTSGKNKGIREKIEEFEKGGKWTMKIYNTLTRKKKNLFL